MAVYNEIQAGRFNRFIQKLTGIKGGPPMKQLGSELMPVMPYTNGVETRYLESWHRFAIGSQAAGVAAQQSGVNFRNPTNSNHIAVFEKISILNVNGAQETFNLTYAHVSQLDLPTAQTPTNLDFRDQGIGNQIIVTNGIGAVGLLNTLYFVVQPGNGIQDVIITENQEITLLPGDNMRINCGTVNTTVSAMAIWRERFLEDSERF